MSEKIKVTWLIIKTCAHLLKTIYAGRTWNELSLSLEEKEGRRIIRFRRCVEGYAVTDYLVPKNPNEEVVKLR